MEPIDPLALKRSLDADDSLALLDVREPGEYNTAHIPSASSLPRRLIEFRAQRLVPCVDVRLVVCDDRGPRAQLAASTLEGMGYRRVQVLSGGVNGWASEDLPTEWGMNVPSKDFGEAVEVRHHVPTVGARELHAWQQAGKPLVILDTRTPDEFRRACIPGGRSVPGGELALRITDIVRENPGATVVVNCAGRTRSIIGARVLQRMGVENVVSLRNGTSGWVLAGLELERGADRTALPDVSEPGHAVACEFARRVANEDGVSLITAPKLQALLGDRDHRCAYAIDVRTEAEYAGGHIAGFQWYPGGQAVQRSDDVVAVRGGTVVFVCDDGARSRIVASWYRQLGFTNVFVVDDGIGAWQAAGLRLVTGSDEPLIWGLNEAAARVSLIAPHRLRDAATVPNGPRVIFVDPSDEFARGHVPGSTWLPRGWLELRIGELAPDHGAPIALTDRSGPHAMLAAATLLDLGYRNVVALAGGVNAWHTAELPLERGLAGVMTAPEDVVAAGPDRSHADMIHYLTWEEALGRKYQGEQTANG